MKKLLFFFLLFLYVQLAAGQPDVVSEVEYGLGSGNYKSITSHLDKTVSLTINGERSTYTHDQASAVIKNFFTLLHHVYSFQILKFGSSLNHNSFLIGILNAKSSNFKLYLFFKEESQHRSMIEGIKIEKI